MRPNEHKQETNNPPMTPKDILQIKIKWPKKTPRTDYSKDAWKRAIQENPKLAQDQTQIKRFFKKQKPATIVSEHPKIHTGKLPGLLAAKKLQKKLMSLATTTEDKEIYKNNITSINNAARKLKTDNKKKKKTPQVNN